MITLIEYAQKVKHTRDLQRRYILAARKGAPGKDKISEESKAAERELDSITTEILTQQTKQADLFA